MRTAAVRGLLRVAAEVRWAVLLAGLTGAATVFAGVGLLGTGAWLIAAAALQPALAEIQVAVVGVRFFGISRAVLRYLDRLIAHDATLRLLARLRVRFVRAMEPLAPAPLIERRTGDVLDRAVSDIAALQPLVVRCLGPFVAAALVGSGTTILLSCIADSAAVPFTVGFGLLAVVVPVMVVRHSRRAQRRLGVARALMSSTIVDLVQGLADLVAFNADGDQNRKVKAAAGSWRRERLAEVDFNALAAGLGVLISNGTVVAILVLSIDPIRAGDLDPVILGAICLVGAAAFEAAVGLPSAARELHNQVESMDRLLDVSEMAPAVVTPQVPQEPEWLAGGACPHIRIEGLGFTFPGAVDPTFEGLDLVIRDGERLAIVGPTGCGKSTLAAMLVRTWDPHEGAVLYGEHDLRNLPLVRLRRRVALVAQRPWLFAGTVAENLRLVAPEATRDDLEAACAAASILETIRGLPEGLETFIGEHGGLLSGGERQRLTVARALLQEPAILILDEATSALDGATGERVLAGIDGWMNGRSQVHITHHLMEMDRYDRIVVMDRGRIVEMGRHADLVGASGCYEGLWRAQIGMLETRTGPTPSQ